jgi:hypothetical protein
MRVGGFALLVAAAVAAAIAVNFVLLGYGGTSDDPVGRLTTRSAKLMARSTAQGAGQAPSPPVTDDHGSSDRRGDDGGRARDQDD